MPDADDFPALPAELAGDAAVAGHVGLAFAVPEGAVGFRAEHLAWLCRLPLPSVGGVSNVKM